MTRKYIVVLALLLSGCAQWRETSDFSTIPSMKSQVVVGRVNIELVPELDREMRQSCWFKIESGNTTFWVKPDDEGILLWSGAREARTTLVGVECARIVPEPVSEEGASYCAYSLGDQQLAPGGDHAAALLYWGDLDLKWRCVGRPRSYLGVFWVLPKLPLMLVRWSFWMNDGRLDAEFVDLHSASCSLAQSRYPQLSDVMCANASRPGKLEL